MGLALVGLSSKTGKGKGCLDNSVRFHLFYFF